MPALSLASPVSYPSNLETKLAEPALLPAPVEPPSTVGVLVLIITEVVLANIRAIARKPVLVPATAFPRPTAATLTGTKRWPSPVLSPSILEWKSCAVRPGIAPYMWCRYLVLVLIVYVIRVVTDGIGVRAKCCGRDHYGRIRGEVVWLCVCNKHRC